MRAPRHLAVIWAKALRMEPNWGSFAGPESHLARSPGAEKREAGHLSLGIQQLIHSLCNARTQYLSPQLPFVQCAGAIRAAGELSPAFQPFARLTHLRKVGPGRVDLFGRQL